MSEYAIEVVNVKKRIGKSEIIKGINFEVNKGEVFGFIGPNGAGKTTTIRMMVGLMGITDGDIRIVGQSIQSEYKEAVQQVGAIVENPELYPFMTGWQNLMHFARMTSGVTKERIREVISIVGMEKPIHQKVKRYSLGMRQRLGIAQALLHRPAVLILDEPTNGLDPSGIREIRTYVRRLAEEEGVAVIISSHLLAEIEQICDRIAIIQNGRIIQVQSVHDSGMESSANMQEVQVEVTPIQEARSILEKKYELDVQRTKQLLSFSVPKETIPEIVQTLTSHGVAIYELRITKQTLEDRFLSMVGENTIE